MHENRKNFSDKQSQKIRNLQANLKKAKNERKPKSSNDNTPDDDQEMESRSEDTTEVTFTSGGIKKKGGTVTFILK